VREHARLIDGMFEIAEEVGSARLLSCGGRVRLASLQAPPTALAWELEKPIGAVRVNLRPRYGIALSSRPLPHGRQIARAGRWRATQLPCPGRRPGQEVSELAIAGVSGTAR
jgi:hypothetical protein